MTNALRPEAGVLTAAAFWRRLDTSGSDAARLFQTTSGWRLEGTAVFVQEKKPARLDYALDLASDWSTKQGVIRGFIGAESIDQTIVRDANGWSMNGRKVAGLEELQDVDFGFTPTTNLPQVRRANLRVGESIDFSVAWWEPGKEKLMALPQHYRRQSEWTYWYESPMGPYRAELEFAPNGFVRHYPELWVMESVE